MWNLNATNLNYDFLFFILDSPFRPFSRIDSPAVENTDDLIVLDSDEEETANAADKNAGKSQEKNDNNKSNDGNKSRPESQASNRSRFVILFAFCSTCFSMSGIKF